SLYLLGAPRDLHSFPTRRSSDLVAVVILILGAVIYGGWNARNPVVNEYEVTVNKEAGSRKELRIAMVSDIHFGNRPPCSPSPHIDRKSTRLNSSHVKISYAVFCL